MKQTKQIMGMPVTIELVGTAVSIKLFGEVFDYFKYVDAKYSTYKKDSEISQINHGLPKSRWSAEMKLVMGLCDQTKRQTGGYFNIENNGKLDPSGLVKGWAIYEAAKILKRNHIKNFCIDVAGDIQVRGSNEDGQPWSVGIRNPFDRTEIIKVVYVTTEGVATSGTAFRGQHIYNPKAPQQPIHGLVSITVVGPDIYNADRFATAAFAMGKKGLGFIESQPNYEAYIITSDKRATLTQGFERYTQAHA